MAFNPNEQQEIVNRRIGLSQIVTGQKREENYEGKENDGYE